MESRIKRSGKGKIRGVEESGGKLEDRILRRRKRKKKKQKMKE